MSAFSVGPTGSVNTLCAMKASESQKCYKSGSQHGSCTIPVPSTLSLIMSSLPDLSLRVLQRIPARYYTYTHSPVAWGMGMPARVPHATRTNVTDVVLLLF